MDNFLFRQIRLFCSKKCNTIFALATHIKDSGSPVAIIRISGPDAVSAAMICMREKSRLMARKTSLRHIVDPNDGRVIDRALVTFFPGPNSFTGEDVIEVSVHGSRPLISSLTRVLSCQPGLRPAEAGEFTRRSVLNGKMDLVQAEGVRDLISAQTQHQMDIALRGMRGQESAQFTSWRERLIKCLAHLEAAIDFGEDELLPEETVNGVKSDLIQLRNDMDLFVKRGKRQRDIGHNGVQVVIVGAPNVGKSSLMNTLCNRNVSIVSSIKGTTRDVIETLMELNGHLVRISDTAGIRDSNCELEEMGIERGKKRVTEADVLIHVIDSEDTIHQSGDLIQEEINALVSPKTLVLKVRNKVDLINDGDHQANKDISFISCKTGSGIDGLMDSLRKSVDQVRSSDSDVEAPFVTERVVQLVSLSLQSLDSCVLQLDRQDMDLSTASHMLRRSCTLVGSILGSIGTDDVLNVIFRDFCIGK